MVEFTPSRMDLARRRRGLSKKDLAGALGVSARTLLSYERGETTPSEAVLDLLAEQLDFPLEFFFGPEISEPAVAGVSFRSKSSMTARQRDKAISSATLATTLVDWMEEQFALPALDVPRLRDVDPEVAAEEVRAAWGLGSRSAPNMVHLLEAHGVRVFSLVEECLEVDAFSFWRNGEPFVFLNTMKSPEHSRMDAAHELGHLVMHFWGGPDGRDAEEQAKSFASAFLMPRGSVIAEAPRSPSIPAIVRAKHRWRVSAMALAYRMRKVGLLTEWQARSVFIEMSRAGYRTAEPDGLKRQETSQLLAKIFAALRDDGITMRSIANRLHVPVEELNNVVFGLTMTGISGGGLVNDGRAHLRLVEPG
jgi:Zn-dependent peptidase ImmA (M78 family)/transcriptional regulator with XRE-family HTH domain